MNFLLALAMLVSVARALNVPISDLASLRLTKVVGGVLEPASQETTLRGLMDSCKKKPLVIFAVRRPG